MIRRTARRGWVRDLPGQREHLHAALVEVADLTDPYLADDCWTIRIVR